MNLDELITRYNRDKDDFQTQLALANHLHCPIEILEQLVSSNYLQVSETAKLHVKLAGEIIAGWQEAAETAIHNADLGQNDEIVAELLEFAPVPDFLVSKWMPWKKIQTAVENLYLPVWRDRLLIRLAEHWAIDPRIYAAGCEHTPVPCLEILAGDISVEIRTLVSFHPNSLETWFETIQQQRDLATSWHTPPQQLASLAASKWVWIRLAVAENPYTPGDILLKFAKESSFLLAIAKNPLAPTEALDIIAQKSDTYINKALAEHPKASESILWQLPTDCNQIIVERADFPNLPYSVLTKLASDRKIRYLILNNPNAPSFILDKLANCSERRIQQELAKEKNKNNNQQLEQFVGNVFISQNILRDEEINRCLELADNNGEIEKCIEKFLTKSHLRTCLEIAKNPATENYILERLANYPNFWQSEIRSTHPSSRSTSLLNLPAFSKNLNKPLKLLHDLRCAVVSHPNTPSDTLASFAYDSGDAVLELLAKNPNTPVDILSYLANNSLYLIRIAVAENPSTPLNILLELARDNNNFVRDIVDKNSSIDSLQRYRIRLNKIQEKLIKPNYFLFYTHYFDFKDTITKPVISILEQLVREKNIATHLELAKGESTPASILETLVTHKNIEVRKAIASNWITPKSVREQLAEDSDVEVRKALASYHNTHSAILEQLANDIHVEVRREVICHRNTPNKVLTYLIKSENFEYLLKQAESNHGFADRNKVLMVIAEHPATNETILTRLSLIDNRKILQTLAKNPSTPQNILTKLARSSDLHTRRNVAENSHISEVVLEELANKEDRFVLVAMAKNNPNLPNRVIHILSDRSDFNISNALAENKSIDVSILEELAKHNQINIRLNVAKNSNASSSLLKQLANDSSALVRREVAKNPNTSLETLTKLSRDSDWVTLWEISKHSNVSDRVKQQVLTKIAEDRSAATSEYRLELAKNIDTNSHILEKLIDSSEINIRYTLAKREDLKWYLSEQLWLELVNDPDKHKIIVQSENNPNHYIYANLYRELDALPFILENYASSSIPLCRFAAYLHPLLPNYFYKIAANSRSWLERYAITQNPNIPTKIKQYLTQDANRIVRAAAKANNSSKVSFSIPQIPKTKLDSKQLLATLNILLPELSQKVNDPETWEYRERYETFLWLTEKQGQFSFAKFMQNYDLLNKISLQKLCDRWSQQRLRDTNFKFKTQATPESNQKCQDLIQLLQNNLNNVQSYRVKFRNSKKGFDIIIGKINNNSWLGLSCLLSSRKEKLITSDIKDTSQISLEILPLIEQIKRLTVDFKPIVQNIDFMRCEGIIWEVAATQELLIEKLLKTANIIKVETFCDRENHSYGSVNNFLKTYLTDIQTYTLGENFPYYYEIYTVGQTPAKDYLIFSIKVSSSP